jgi:hypothetical protein
MILYQEEGSKTGKLGKEGEQEDGKLDQDTNGFSYQIMYIPEKTELVYSGVSYFTVPEQIHGFSSISSFPLASKGFQSQGKLPYLRRS